AVRLALRVVVALGAHAIAGAAIAGLVDVETVLLPGAKTGDLAGDADLVAGLGELDRTGCLVALGGLQAGGGARTSADAQHAAAGSQRSDQDQQKPVQPVSHFFLPLIAAAWRFL